MTETAPIEITINTPREVRAINGWADVDRLMLALRIADVELGQIAASFDARIADLTEAKQRAVQPIVNRRERMEALAKNWIEEHRAEMLDKKGQPAKSVKLVHGTVGFRKGQVSISTEDEEKAIALLEKRGHADCVVTRQALVKDAVKKLEATELFMCGFKLSQEERFYVQLSKSPAITYPTAAEAEPEPEVDDA